MAGNPVGQPFARLAPAWVKLAALTILISAGVRLIAQNTLLFEKLVNFAHADAPRAKLCFNIKPTDTAAVVQRWCPATKQ
jgi:hypothetical protein